MTDPFGYDMQISAFANDALTDGGEMDREPQCESRRRCREPFCL
jgi:hypothetical protein